MLAQSVSKQDILKVRKIPRDEHEADVLEKHVPRAILDKLGDSLENLFLVRKK